MLKLFKSLQKVKVTVFTRGGVVVDVKGDTLIEYKIKDLDDKPALCLTCGVRDNGITDVCVNGHDDWLEDMDVEQRNVHYQRAIKQCGYAEDVFLAMFNNPKNNFIKQNKKTP
jgi:hypothetical protein